MELDTKYLQQLETAARAPDHIFPEMLFNPLTNEYDDIYFKLDVDDYGQDAVKVDPRFTKKNIMRIRGSTKRIDRYLEWIALWDDYMAYLDDKYGGLEMAYEMEQAGILRDPLPTITHRPVLRKGKIRRLFKQGIVPSFQPYGVNPVECFSFVKEVCDQAHSADERDGLDDIEDIFRRSHKKKYREMAKRTSERYRRMQRVEMLTGGSGIPGVTSNMNFIDQYYLNLGRGAYDTTFSNRDVTGESLVAIMNAAEDRKFWHEGKIAAEANATDSSRYVFDGHMARDKEKTKLFEIYKALQTEAGIDILGTLSGSMDKKRYKALRRGFEAVGGVVPLTKKQQKKLKKKQRKLDRQETRALKADQALAEILLNNKISLNNTGTVRFEDMSLRRDWDDDD